MMENVYVIKVKTKPPLSSLYPSERRYSASTVGGLSFVHFGLGALSLLLGTLALSLQGPILSVACLVPFVTGLLAWRRWYIDRNIAIFFYGSLFSLVAAILCFVATALDVAATTEGTAGSLWSLEEMFEPPHRQLTQEEHTKKNDSLDGPVDVFNTSEDYLGTLAPGIPMDKSLSTSGYTLKISSGRNRANEELRDYDGTTYDDFKEGTSLEYEEKPPNPHESSGNDTQQSMETIKKKVVSFWRKNYEDTSQTRVLLTMNVLVASLLEILWSALSAKIAFRGMMNRLPETGYGGNAAARAKPERSVASKRKPPAPRPDILDHDRRLSESLQNLNALHNLRNSGPGLPLPESSREFRERVERFLANQAAHRIAEGSCT